MKNLKYHCYILLIAVLACGVVTSAPAASPGSLTIYRAANLGTGVFLDINIDGANAATVGMGQTYTGSLSPGTHQISVLLRPNLLFLAPTKKTLMVEGGRTYAFTAMWQGQNLVLR
jgi:ABC-type molybdate transport system substrate-binding protein